MKKNKGVIPALKDAVRAHRLLAAGTILCVAASVGASLLPPLLLMKALPKKYRRKHLRFPLLPILPRYYHCKLTYARV